ncbi:MAG: hypothetical protein Q7S43_04235 [bacterium]|nr:hypothetical protein [bacterium]
MLSKLLNIIKSSQYHIFLASCIGLIAFISYNLGQIDALQQTPIKIVESGVLKAGSNSLKADIYSATQTEAIDNKAQTKVLDTRVMASKNSDKYHYTWCAGAKKIKEENKVWFSSAQEAETNGYTLAGNCQP